MLETETEFIKIIVPKFEIHFSSRIFLAIGYQIPILPTDGWSLYNNKDIYINLKEINAQRD